MVLAAELHSAAVAVRKRQHAVHVREIAQQLRREPPRDVMGHRRRAIHVADDRDVISRARAAVCPAITLERVTLKRLRDRRARRVDFSYSWRNWPIAMLCECTHWPGSIGRVANPIVSPHFRARLAGGNRRNRDLVAVPHGLGQRQLPTARGDALSPRSRFAPPRRCCHADEDKQRQA